MFGGFDTDLEPTTTSESYSPPIAGPAFWICPNRRPTAPWQWTAGIAKLLWLLYAFGARSIAAVKFSTMAGLMSFADSWQHRSSLTINADQKAPQTSFWSRTRPDQEKLILLAHSSVSTRTGCLHRKRAGAKEL